MYNVIDKVNIELTDKCNSRCPQCHRTDSMNNCKPYSWIQNIEWTLDDFKKAFPPKTKFPSCIFFCGTYGDPLMCSDLFGIVKYIMENSNSHVLISTNGSVRDEDWWFIFSQWGKRVRVLWSVDGLEDTNHLYRRGTDFKKIMKNAQAYIDGRGVAEWIYIVFKHNQHQIQEAKRLSESMGFETFKAVKSERWNSQTSKDLEKYIWKDKEYKLEPPTNKFKNEKVNEWHLEDDKEKVIDCYAIRDQEVWIDCFGYVTPCCFYQNKIYRLLNSNKNNFDFLEIDHKKIKTSDTTKTKVQNIIKKFKLKQINIFNNTFEEINKSYLFNNYIKGYVWKHKLNPCYDVCGKGIQKEFVKL